VAHPVTLLSPTRKEPMVAPNGTARVRLDTAEIMSLAPQESIIYAFGPNKPLCPAGIAKTTRACPQVGPVTSAVTSVAHSLLPRFARQKPAYAPRTWLVGVVPHLGMEARIARASEATMGITLLVTQIPITTGFGPKPPKKCTMRLCRASHAAGWDSASFPTEYAFCPYTTQENTSPIVVLTGHNHGCRTCNTASSETLRKPASGWRTR